MRTAFYPICVFLLLTSCAAVQAAEIQWLYDLDSAKRAAALSNRPILLHFWSPTCDPCHRLDQNVYTRPEVKRAMETMFVLVRLNVEEYSATASVYGVQSWPADVILAPNGQFVALLKCPQAPEQYVAQLEQVARRSGTPATSPSMSNDAQLAARPAMPHNALPAGQIVQTSGESRPAAGQASGNGLYSWGDPNSRVANYDFRNMNYGAGQSAVQGSLASTIEMPRQASPPTPAVLNQQLPPRGPVADSPYMGQAAVGMQPQSTVAGMAPSGFGPAANGFGGVYGATPQQPSTAPLEQRPAQQQFVQQNVVPPAQAGIQATQLEMVLATQAPPVALDGYCPVQLARPADKRQAKWVKGDPRYGVVHRGRTYLFAGPTEQQEFLRDPDRYSPVMSGNDPVLLFDVGQQVAGSRKLGVFFGDRVYLFANEQTLAKFTADKKRYAEAVFVAENPGRGTLR